MTIVLPTKDHVPNQGWPEYSTYLVAGATKIGKTDFVSQWPKCLIINLEPNGCDHVSGAKVLDISELDYQEGWKELGNVFALLHKQGKKIEFETVAIDTIDVVNDWAEQIACAELGITRMGEATYGADWGASRLKVLNTIKVFSQLPVNLLIVSHSRWAIVNDIKLGHTIDLPGKLARFTMAAIDNILFIISEGGKRKLVFQPTEGIEAGSRNPILSRVGSCDFSYAALKALFNGKESANEGK